MQSMWTRYKSFDKRKWSPTYDLSTTSQTTYMTILKNLLKLLKIRSLIWKKTQYGKTQQKEPFTGAWRWGQFFAVPLLQIQQKQTFFQQKKGYLAYQKLSILNTKIRNISDKLKDICGITIGTDHPQCAETSNPILNVKIEIEDQFKIVRQFIKRNSILSAVIWS